MEERRHVGWEGESPRAPTARVPGPSFLEGTVELTAWQDPFLERHGVDVRSVYVERFWLPVLGPSATLLLRHLAGHLERSSGGVRLALPTVARSLGLAVRSGRNAPFTRALERCGHFAMLRMGPRLLEARCKVGPVPRHHLARLPDDLVRHHDACFEAARCTHTVHSLVGG